MDSSNILVVEDNAAHAELISLAFEPDPEFSLQLTPCLQEARAAIAARAPELVITDLLLPDGRGIDLLAAEGRALKFPVVVMTGYGDEAMAVEAMKAGAVHYVVKSEQSLADLPRLATSTLREWDHIVEQRKTEEALQASERRYRRLFDNNPSMFFTVDARGIVASANRFAAEQLGRKSDEIVGRSLAEIHVQQERVAIARHLDRCFREPEVLHRWDTCQARRDGTPIWVNVTARVVTSVDSEALALIVCEDVTAARQLSDHQIFHASHDPLTGLANRGQFERSLQQALGAARTEQSEHTLCYLDLDQSAATKDTSERAAGDELLRQFSDLLKQTVRRHDTLARLGDNKFGIVLTDCSTTDAVRVTKSLQKAVGEFRLPGESRNSQVGVSVGLVPVNETSDDSTALLAAADAACRAARERGRDLIYLHHKGGAVPYFQERTQAEGQETTSQLPERVIPVANAPAAGAPVVNVPAAHTPAAGMLVESVPDKGAGETQPVVRAEQPSADISGDAVRPRVRQNVGRSRVAEVNDLSPEAYRILHVDDDPVIRYMTEQALKMAGFDVWSAGSGRQALDLIAERGFPHLALVDIFMPEMSGFELCSKIQASADLPIIMVTSVDDSETEEETLREVAEDYVIKPFDLRVLVARVERLLRRIGDFAYALGPRIRVDDRLEVELGRRRIHVNGEVIPLTRTETKLLYILMRNAGQTVTSDFLLRRVWPHEEIYENVLRTHVGRLRKKIERSSGRPQYVMTRRGMGYFFKAKR